MDTVICCESQAISCCLRLHRSWPHCPWSPASSPWTPWSPSWTAASWRPDGQTGYLSAIQIAGTGLQFLGLLYLGSQHMISALTIWACLKLVTLFRLAGGCVRNLASSKSVYYLPRPGPGLVPGPD